tara:strand:- start:814 stop:1395 length:582 start_codon:yes stop_codon:yes gene_type:complete
MPFKMKGFSGFKDSSPMKKTMGPTEDKVAFEKPAQKKTKKQVRQENRADRRATRKSEGSIARQALRRGVNKVKAAASNLTQKKVKKKDVVTQTSRKIQAPKPTAKVNDHRHQQVSKPSVRKGDFKKTFAMERAIQGAGGKFKYGGKSYNTNLAKPKKRQSTATRVGNKLVSPSEKKRLTSKRLADKIPQGNKF